MTRPPPRPARLPRARDVQMISREEERELVLAWRAGSQRALAKIMAAHEPLIGGLVEEAYERACGRIEREDLMQEGRYFFLRGLEKYDPDRGFRVNTYCRWWVRSELGKLAAHSGLVRVPLSDPIRTIRAHHSRLQKQLQQARSREEASEMVDAWCAEHGVPRDEYDAHSGAHAAPARLRAEQGDHGVDLADDRPNPEEALLEERSARRLEALVHRAVARLPPRERLAAEMRVLAETPEAYQDVADALGLSVRSAKKATHRALALLRQSIRARAAGLDE